MDRREFVIKTCMACAGSGMMAALLSSCKADYYVQGVLETKGISVPNTIFTVVKNDKPATRSFIIVHNDKLDYPIYLYRVSETEFNALLMRCTHQSSELQAAGDHLYCPGHGSEFTKAGKVIQGPAEQPLRSFPVSVVGDNILIELK